jgi:uncharacterized Ntn-hydrolase superfamily protein
MRVPYAAPGVGAVATQAFTERSFGPRGLELLRAGADPAEVVEKLIAAEPAPGARQLGVLAADGESAGFTGPDCPAFAEEAAGTDCRAQANLMATEDVPDAMRAAFEASEGELSVRLLAALRAGEAAGGDVRGRMSAALLVVPAAGEAWRKTVDLRVDHSNDPLPELARALDYHRAYAALDLAAERGRAGDGEGAMQAGMLALSLAPDHPQLLLWMGLGVAGDNLDAGLAMVQRALELQPSLAPVVERLSPNQFPAVDEVRAALSG